MQVIFGNVVNVMFSGSNFRFTISRDGFDSYLSSANGTWQTCDTIVYNKPSDNMSDSALMIFIKLLFDSIATNLYTLTKTQIKVTDIKDFLDIYKRIPDTSKQYILLLKTITQDPELMLIKTCLFIRGGNNYHRIVMNIIEKNSLDTTSIKFLVELYKKNYASCIQYNRFEEITHKAQYIFLRMIDQYFTVIHKKDIYDYILDTETMFDFKMVRSNRTFRDRINELRDKYESGNVE